MQAHTHTHTNTHYIYLQVNSNTTMDFNSYDCLEYKHSTVSRLSRYIYHHTSPPILFMQYIPGFLDPLLFLTLCPLSATILTLKHLFKSWLSLRFQINSPSSKISFMYPHNKFKLVFPQLPRVYLCHLYLVYLHWEFLVSIPY